MSNYTILYFAGSLPTYRLLEYYEKNCLSNLSYADAINEFRKAGMLIPTNWGTCMRKLGNECLEIIPQFTILQAHWCKENGIVIEDDTDDITNYILYSQIKKIKPDVLFLYSQHMKLYNIKEIKNQFPFIKIVAGYHGDYHLDYSKFKDIDISFACNSDYRNMLKSAGIESHENHNSFDDIYFREMEISNTETEHDFIHVGSTGFKMTTHINRYKNLKYLLDNSTIKCWTHDNIKKTSFRNNCLKFKNYIRQELRNLIIDAMSKLGYKNLEGVIKYIKSKSVSPKIFRIIKESLDKKDHKEVYTPAIPRLTQKPLNLLFPEKVINDFVLNYYSLLASSKVIFNAHRDEPADYSNIRIFEATGVGSCLITDKPNNVKKYFVPDEEILTYASMEECVEKVKYVLDNEAVRKEISLKGQLRTMRNYTTMDHCEKIHDVLKRKL
jgi:spore maturation protein CgeB